MDTGYFDPTRVLVLVGPTGCGKTSLAVDLCRNLEVEMVCMDSMQVYRELRVGTSRPTAAETASAPHHLFGSVGIEETMTCVRYTRMAAPVLAEIQSRGRTPLLVGGTGLYMRALFEGTASLPRTPAALRRRLDALAERRGRAWLWRMLERLDPQSAASLHPNDRQRIQRFLEIRVLTGRSVFHYWNAQDRTPKPLPLAIGLSMERPLLRRKIDLRLRQMLQAGWVSETRELIEKGLIEAVCRSGPIGYRHIYDYLEGRSSEADMIHKIGTATKKYAKRQMTWFQKVKYIQWFPFSPESGYNKSAILAYIRSHPR